MFYNTTNETGSELMSRWIKTAKQEEIIMTAFDAFPNDQFTPFEIQTMVKENFKKDFPITSIRRAITDLTEQGKIVKTKETKKGKYGKLNYTWRKND